MNEVLVVLSWTLALACVILIAAAIAIVVKNRELYDLVEHHRERAKGKQELIDGLKVELRKAKANDYRDAKGKFTKAPCKGVGRGKTK